MQYSIKVNEVKNKEGSIRGFATVVFGDSFKITNISIHENREKGQLFVSMPRYKSNERDEHNEAVYKDVCNPITAEFREELYGKILEAYEQVVAHTEEKQEDKEKSKEMPEFTVKVTPFERENSNIRGLARIYFEDSFVVGNVNILQGKGSLFVAMPTYKTNRKDEQGKTVYQDICYPVTKEFREKLYGEIMECYEHERSKKHDEIRGKNADIYNEDKKVEREEELPFR